MNNAHSQNISSIGTFVCLDVCVGEIAATADLLTSYSIVSYVFVFTRGMSRMAIGPPLNNIYSTAALQDYTQE